MPALSTAQRAKIRRLSQPRELAPDEEGGELNIVPFLDIIMNILIFVLATVAVVFTTTIETTAPALKSTGVRAATPKESLNLTVLIVNEGFALKASGGNVAPGCSGGGEGLAIPKKGARYDLEGLRSCAERLKASNPAFADEEQVFLGANPGTDYAVVIDVMDALRTTQKSGSPLFPNVKFNVAK